MLDFSLGCSLSGAREPPAVPAALADYLVSCLSLSLIYESELFERFNPWLTGQKQGMLGLSATG